MKNMFATVTILVLAIFFTAWGFTVAMAGTINGYNDNRRNTANNFDAPQGNGFEEYSENYINAHSWNFTNDPQTNNGYPGGDNSFAPVNVRDDNFKDYLYANDEGTTPNAIFEIEVIAPDGSSRGKIPCNAAQNINTATPRIAAYVGDTLRMIDYSQPSPGQNLVAWDFQWVLMRVAPDGYFLPYVASGQEEHWPDGTNAVSGNIIASSKGELEQYASSIELTEPGFLQLYMAVQDDFDCGPNGSNWSTNGNYVVKGTPNGTGFPWHCWWYYTSLIVEVQPAQELDMFTTGMGSPVWQPEYVVERRYSATPDPVTLMYNRENRINIMYSFCNDSDQDMVDVPVKVVACFGGDETGAGGYVINVGTVSIPAGERTEDTELVVDYDKLGLGEEYTKNLLVAVVLDPDNIIPESNEENNIVLFRAGDTKEKLSVDVYAPPEGFLVNSTGWATISVSREDTRDTSFEAILTIKCAWDNTYYEVPLHVPAGKAEIFATTVEHYSAVSGAKLVSAWITWQDSEGEDQDAIRFSTTVIPNVPPPPEYEDDVIVDINGS